MLQQAPKELEAVIKKQKELGVVNKNTLELSAKYRDSIADTQQAWRSMVGSILETVLPAFIKFQELLAGFFIFLREHQGFVVGFFIVLGAAILKYAIPPLILMAKAVWLAVAPFLPIIALVTAIAVAIGLLVDDIIVFFQGGDSLIGRMLPALKNIWGWLVKFFPSIKLIDMAIKSIVGFVKQLMGMSWGSWDDFLNNMAQIGDNIKESLSNAFSKIKEFIDPIIEWITDKWSSMVTKLETTFKPFIDWFSNAWSSMVTDLQGKFQPFLDGIDKIKNGIGDAWGNMTGSLGFGKGNNETNTTNNNNTTGIDTININIPSGNPQDIANGLTSSLEEATYNTVGARGY
ncbi:MAG: hypothetical protein ACRC31_06130, partial [Cetobacterium sp.]